MCFWGAVLAECPPPVLVASQLVQIRTLLSKTRPNESTCEPGLEGEARPGKILFSQAWLDSPPPPSGSKVGHRACETRAGCYHGVLAGHL